ARDSAAGDMRRGCAARREAAGDVDAGGAVRRDPADQSAHEPEYRRALYAAALSAAGADGGHWSGVALAPAARGGDPAAGVDSHLYGRRASRLSRLLQRTRRHASRADPGGFRPGLGPG